MYANEYRDWRYNSKLKIAFISSGNIGVSAQAAIISCSLTPTVFNANTEPSAGHQNAYQFVICCIPITRGTKCR